MARTPKRLKHDAIVDAVCEIRFDCTENRETPEVVVGMLAGATEWKGYEKKALPASQIPEQIRKIDPDLRGKPTLELIPPESTRRIRLGSHSVSTSRFHGYPGWDVMIDEVREVLSVLFNRVEDIQPFRLGLRYINVLRPKYHHIKNLHELNFKVEMSDSCFDGDINLNLRKTSGSHMSTIRLASPGFVSNMDPVDGVGVVDIDVVSMYAESLDSVEKLLEWYEAAHTEEKRIFFGLFPDELLERLVEEWT